MLTMCNVFQSIKKAKNGKQSKNAIVTMPGIVSDIDGVIVKGKDQIPAARETLETLLKPVEFLNGQKHKLPFVFLTNGGGITEKTKIE